MQQVKSLDSPVQIKLLKLLGQLGAGDQAASENMYGVVGAAMQKAALHGNTIGNAIVYEAARAITTAYPNANLLQSGVYEKLVCVSYSPVDGMSKRLNSALVHNGQSPWADHLRVEMLDCLH